jgi:hypothetical protein
MSNLVLTEADYILTRQTHEIVAFRLGCDTSL